MLVAQATNIGEHLGIIKNIKNNLKQLQTIKTINCQLRGLYYVSIRAYVLRASVFRIAEPVICVTASCCVVLRFVWFLRLSFCGPIGIQWIQ